MHVQACLSAWEDRGNNFLPCCVPVSIVQAWLCVGQPDNAVLTSEGVLRKRCEVGASLFMCEKDLITPF